MCATDIEGQTRAKHSDSAAWERAKIVEQVIAVARTSTRCGLMPVELTIATIVMSSMKGGSQMTARLTGQIPQEGRIGEAEYPGKAEKIPAIPKVVA
jgi:hypothetical protein